MRLPGSFMRSWDKLGASRRAAWAMLAMLIAVVVAMLLVAAPLRDAIARTRDDVARARLVLDIARMRVAESASLARAAAPIRERDPRAALDRALSREGVTYTVGESQAGSVRIVIEQARFDALVRALDALAQDGGVRAVDAAFTARVDPGTVRAELSLVR